MQLTVQLFGPYAHALQTRSVTVEWPDDAPATAGALKDALATRYPAVAPLMTTAFIAVNHRAAQADTPVGPTDELALIGLVGGG